MRTYPDVYIIESLDPDDEGNGRFEGVHISQLLRLHGKEPKYEYVRTRTDFEKAIQNFGKSKYRYLHISAHGDSEGMCTTNLDDIGYDDFACLLTPQLKNKRLFLSACSMVHEELAKELIPRTNCYSVVGPIEDIYFTDAAVVWASIYHLMFKLSETKMSTQGLKRQLQKVCDLFDVKLGYYSRSKKRKRGYSKNLLE